MTPGYHLISNLVYSADTAVVRTVICDGRVLMREGVISGESRIVTDLRAAASKFAPLALRLNGVSKRNTGE